MKETIRDKATLYCGDTLEILPTIPAMSIDAVITDPPYMLAAGSNGSVGGKIGTWGDMMNAALFFSTWYREVWRVLKQTGAFWTFCNWRSLSVIQKALFDARIPFTQLIVWDKLWISTAAKNQLRQSYELIVLAAKKDFIINDRSQPDILKCKWMASNSPGKYHPAEKPVDLLNELIRLSSLGSEHIVLDVFMGSGSTGVACIQNDVQFIGIEQDPEYYKVAKERIESAREQKQLFELTAGANNGLHGDQKSAGQNCLFN